MKYLDDSYAKELEATVVKVKDDKFIVLDDTIFYPQGGGQPFDTGTITKDGETYNVVFVGKFDGKISHELDKPGLKEGDKVNLKIDWDRRYKLMRMHTSAHLLSAVLHSETNALMTGNQLGVEKSRIDFSQETFDKEEMIKLIEKANAHIAEDLPVKVYSLPKEEAMKIPGVVKLANALPPDIPELRIVSIGDVDTQADGGTHVNSLKEIGKINFLKAENKGKSNRRVYFNLE